MNLNKLATRKDANLGSNPNKCVTLAELPDINEAYSQLANTIKSLRQTSDLNKSNLLWLCLGESDFSIEDEYTYQPFVKETIVPNYLYKFSLDSKNIHIYNDNMGDAFL